MVRFIIRYKYESRHLDYYLHSNMVRFIINDSRQEVKRRAYLHSNMVRFIIKGLANKNITVQEFTFQYG